MLLYEWGRWCRHFLSCLTFNLGVMSCGAVQEILSTPFFQTCGVQFVVQVLNIFSKEKYMWNLQLSVFRRLSQLFSVNAYSYMNGCTTTIKRAYHSGKQSTLQRRAHVLTLTMYFVQKYKAVEVGLPCQLTTCLLDYEVLKEVCYYSPSCYLCSSLIRQ